MHRMKTCVLTGNKFYLKKIYGLLWFYPLIAHSCVTIYKFNLHNVIFFLSIIDEQSSLIYKVRKCYSILEYA